MIIAVLTLILQFNLLFACRKKRKEEIETTTEIIPATTEELETTEKNINYENHLTLLGTANDDRYNHFDFGYATHTDGIFQEDRFYNRPKDSLYRTVSAIFKDSVYIFGADFDNGQSDGRAIQMVKGCEIIKLSSTLLRDVDMDAGIVSTSDGVYTCFRYYDYNWCQLFDGSSTQLLNYTTRYDHETGCMAVLNGNPTAIGGYGGSYVETLRSSGWTELTRHIINTYKAGCTTVGNNIITIGGLRDKQGVYMYNGSNGNWSKLGNLIGIHQCNAVIQYNGVIYSSTYSGQIERIELSESEITNSTIISSGLTDSEVFSPVLFPSDRFDCSETQEETTTSITTTTTSTTSTTTCKCFDEIPTIEDDKDHLTLLGTASNYSSLFEFGYATHIDGIFQEDRFYNRPEFSLYLTVSAIFKDSVYIFGADIITGYGPYDGRTIQMVKGCEIIKLSFTLLRYVDVYASIVSTSDGVYTCFREYDNKWCQLFDGSSTQLLNYNTKHDHELGCMAVLNGNPTAIGGHYGGPYVETLRSSGWTELTPHIINPWRSGCTTVGNNMVTIGGYEDNQGVYMYNGSNGNWSKLGNLIGYHYFNSVIQLNGVIYSSTQFGHIERIELSESEITNSTIIFSCQTDSFVYSPVLFPSNRFDCSETEGSSIL